MSLSALLEPPETFSPVTTPWVPHIASMFSKKSTHHDVHELGNGVDECPDPFSMGLSVDGAIGRANGHAPRALLGVYLQEVERPEQVLGASTPWSELITNDELPDDLDHSLACSKELVKEPSLGRRPAPTAMWRAVH